MNLHYIKQKRTKISGLISILLLFAAVVLLLMDFVTDSETDTFFIVFFFLVTFFIFAVLGTVKGNKESLGYTLCFPSLVLSSLFFLLFALAGLVSNLNARPPPPQKETHKLYNILASNYLYQYETKVTENTASGNCNSASALFALCQAYDFFDDEKYKSDTAFLMSLLAGFEASAKTDEQVPFYRVEKYFQASEDNVYEFYMPYGNTDYEVIFIRNQKTEDKYFIRDKKFGFVKHIGDVFGGYEKVIASEKLTDFEKEIIYAYRVFTISDIEINRPNESESVHEIFGSRSHDEISALGYDWSKFLKDVEKEKSKPHTEDKIRLWLLMQSVFHTHSDISEFSIALFSDALYSKYVLNYL